MERYAMVLVRSFRDRGHEVHFHTQRADESLAAELGVRLHLFPFRRFPRKLQGLRFFRQVERLGPRARGLQIALSRVPVNDLAVCGGTHRGYLRGCRKLTGPFDLLQIWMESRCYRAARKVVSHSRLCGRELERLYGLPVGKIAVIYPPVDGCFAPLAHPNGRTEARKSLGLPDDKPVFLFPSTGHRRKGLKAICRAFSGMSHPPILAVAGSSFRGSAAFVRCLGYVDDMALAYRAADFTILGSTYEPFGLVGIESVRCGTPLVFEQNIGCLEVVKPEAALTFSVWSVESIRGAVAQAVELAQAGRRLWDKPDDVLLYDPDAGAHAEAILREAGRHQD